MSIPIKYILSVILFSITQLNHSQPSEIALKKSLSFEEYLGYVKKHHPLLKQAELTLSIGEANLLKARGGFDPKIEVDYDRKEFKKTEYYDQLNTTFKIPTWYGIEVKANFEQNSGDFLNPNLTVPDDGLYSVGVSVSLARGLLMNQRMAALKKARFFQEQTKADRDLLVNNLIYEASLAYFKWVEATNEQNIYSTFVENAATRLKAVERSVTEGDKAKINITEARITLQNRQLSLEASTLKKRKAVLIASNFLWIDGIPLEIQDKVIPIVPKVSNLRTSLFLEGITNTETLNNHPKILSLSAKINTLNVDKRLKKNKLLPELNLQYNFLSSKVEDLSAFNTLNYKTFVNFSFPIFLRKERGSLKLAKLKLQDANFDLIATTLSIRNKIDAIAAEIESLTTQNKLITSIVKDYMTLVDAEERKFFLGASSLFLINSREQKLIDAQRKENSLMVKELKATAKLYNVLGVAEPMSEDN